MRIAVDAQPLLDGRKTGIGNYQAALLKKVMAADIDNEYFFTFFSLRHTAEKKRRIREIFGEGAEIHVFRLLSYSLVHFLWTAIPVPHRWFFRKKADISLFFNYYVPPGASGRAFSVVYDTVVRDMPETMDNRTRRVLELTLNSSIERADRIITISEFSKGQIMRHYGTRDDKVTVVPCGIDEDRYHTGYPAQEIMECCKRLGIEGKYMLYLGTLEPRKNISGLIEAFGLLSTGCEDCPKLVVAGGKGWLYDSVFERVKQLGLEDRVLFTGYVSAEDAPLLMSGAELFCFPSFYEGFGMPPLEAMACGTPTVVSDRTSLPEVVGDAALTADPDSPAAICSAMKRVLSEPDLRRALSEKGIARSKQFTWEKSAEALNKLIGDQL